MTELVITDPKFLRAFERRFCKRWWSYFNLVEVRVCKYSAVGICAENEWLSLKTYLSDDEYIWVMLRAMEENLIK